MSRSLSSLLASSLGAFLGVSQVLWAQQSASDYQGCVTRNVPLIHAEFARRFSEIGPLQSSLRRSHETVARRVRSRLSRAQLDFLNQLSLRIDQAHGEGHPYQFTEVDMQRYTAVRMLVGQELGRNVGGPSALSYQHIFCRDGYAPQQLDPSGSESQGNGAAPMPALNNYTCRRRIRNSNIPLYILPSRVRLTSLQALNGPDNYQNGSGATSVVLGVHVCDTFSAALPDSAELSENHVPREGLINTVCLDDRLESPWSEHGVSWAMDGSHSEGQFLADQLQNRCGDEPQQQQALAVVVTPPSASPQVAPAAPTTQPPSEPSVAPTTQQGGGQQTPASSTNTQPVRQPVEENNGSSSSGLGTDPQSTTLSALRDLRFSFDEVEQQYSDPDRPRHMSREVAVRITFGVNQRGQLLNFEASRRNPQNIEEIFSGESSADDADFIRSITGRVESYLSSHVADDRVAQEERASLDYQASFLLEEQGASSQPATPTTPVATPQRPAEQPQQGTQVVQPSHPSSPAAPTPQEQVAPPQPVVQPTPAATPTPPAPAPVPVPAPTTPQQPDTAGVASAAPSVEELQQHQEAVLRLAQQTLDGMIHNHSMEDLIRSVRTRIQRGYPAINDLSTVRYRAEFAFNERGELTQLLSLNPVAGVRLDPRRPNYRSNFINLLNSKLIEAVRQRIAREQHLTEAVPLAVLTQRMSRFGSDVVAFEFGLQL